MNTKEIPPIEDPIKPNVISIQPKHPKIVPKEEKVEIHETISTQDEFIQPKSRERDPEMLHMLMSEVRLQNTEMRLSMMKIHDKLDQMAKPTHNSISANTIDPDVQFKKAMNRLFKLIKSEIHSNEDYNGQDVLNIVATAIKSTTESILVNK